jgi:hypothetical protein
MQPEILMTCGERRLMDSAAAGDRITLTVHWTDEIQQAWAKEGVNTLALARVVQSARRSLQRGDWSRLWELGEVPFSRRKAQMLLVIAKGLDRVNVQTFAQMPHGWSILYCLAQLTRTQLEDLIAEGLVHSRLKLSEARDLVRRFHSDKDRSSVKALNPTRRLEKLEAFIAATLDDWSPKQREWARAKLQEIVDDASASLKALFYPPAESYTTTGFALYDRWSDARVAPNEFVAVQTARSLATAAWLAAQSSANRSQQWGASDITASQGSITPTFSVLSLNAKQMVQLNSSLPLSQARTVWDLLGEEPGLGQSFTFVPKAVGENRLLQAETVFPDGRRVFASRSFAIYDPVNGGTECGSDSSTIALYHFNANYGATLSPQQQTLPVTFNNLIVGRSYTFTFGPHCTAFTSGSTSIPSPTGPVHFVADATSAQVSGSSSYDGALQEYLMEDASPNHHDLTIHGNVTLADNTTWMNTYPNSGKKVARFANAGDYIQALIPACEIVPPAGCPNPQPHPLTIEAWIYPRAYKTDGPGHSQDVVSLYGTYNNSTSASQWKVYYTPYRSPDAPEVDVNPSVPFNNSQWHQYVALNSWHKIVITFETTPLTKLYIDGVLRATSSAAPISGFAGDWTLTLGNFDGDIDEVRISSCVRTPQAACAPCQP